MSSDGRPNRRHRTNVLRIQASMASGRGARVGPDYLGVGSFISLAAVTHGR